MLKAGIIGYKNHAKKIINHIKKKVSISHIFHPQKKLKLKIYTNNLKDLLQLDCIFIACPSDYHFHYLNYFNKKKYQGYIFCEKPPVTKLNDLKKIKKFNYNKVYFNYNLRHSILAKYISNYKKLGKLISLNIYDSKPLIYKKNLTNNWRMNQKGTLISNNFIHYIDLIIFKNFKNLNFGEINVIKNKINHNLKIIDNICIIFKHCNIIYNISLSYTNGLEKLYIFHFQNGKVEITDSLLKIYFPNKKLDVNKNFVKPKLYKKVKIKNIFKESNSKSIGYFLNFVKKKTKFKKTCFQNSINSNKIMLQLLKRI